LVATVYDDEDVATGKYVGLRENVETVRGVGGTVVFCVDATQCHTHALLRRFGLFDRIIFNFPHAGAGIKDQQRNVATNQSLLRATFTASVQLLAPGGQMHITLKRGQPYDSWGAVVIAKMCGLRVLSCSTFSPEAFPGYAHRRTLGDEHAGDADAHLPNAEISVGAKTYAFVSAEDAAAAAAEREPRKGQKNHKAVYKHTSFGMRKM
jgi:25S rRNA (uracil2634-N3)-methyltransferase